jgi:hypothetical protein
LERNVARKVTSEHYAAEWRALLVGPIDALTLVLVADSEQALALRQTSPFTGVLRPKERWAIWKRVRSEFKRSSVRREGGAVA